MEAQESQATAPLSDGLSADGQERKRCAVLPKTATHRILTAVSRGQSPDTWGASCGKWPLRPRKGVGGCEGRGARATHEQVTRAGPQATFWFLHLQALAGSYTDQDPP